MQNRSETLIPSNIEMNNSSEHSAVKFDTSGISSVNQRRSAGCSWETSDTKIAQIKQGYTASETGSNAQSLNERQFSRAASRTFHGCYTKPGGIRGAAGRMVW